MKSVYSAWPYLLIILVTILAYLPSLSGEFILDDRALIQYNPYIKQLHSFTSYLYQEDGVPNKMNGDSYHTGYYRPLINLSYWTDYKLWGMEASGFRSTNLIFHILCCILFFQFLLFFEDKKEIAVAVVLLFGLHPVNTEAVSWITSRNNIIVTVFGLISLISYLKAYEKKAQYFLILSLLSFALALFSKEFGVMLLPVMIVYHKAIGEKANSVRGKEFFRWYTSFVFVLLIYFILRQNATHSWLSPEGAENFFRSLYFAPYLFLKNMQLILFPFDLHSFVVKYPKSYIQPIPLCGIGFSFICLYFLWINRKKSILAFLLISFLIALFPIMNIISTSSMSLVSMRWLYFPMVFLGPIGCIAIKKLFNINKMMTIIAICIAIIYFGGYSYYLNKNLWQSEEKFFQKEIHEFRNSYYAYGYALKHLEAGDIENSEKYFKIALDGYHNKKAAVYLKYSEMLIQQKRFKDVIPLLKKDGMLPSKVQERGLWYSHLGTAYYYMGEKNHAIKYYQKAVSCCPKESEFWAKLGGAYGSIRAYSKSLDVLRKGLVLNPDSVLIRMNLAQTYLRIKEYHDAMQILKEIEPAQFKKNKKLLFLLKKAKKGLKNNKI